MLKFKYLLTSIAFIFYSVNALSFVVDGINYGVTSSTEMTVKVLSNYYYGNSNYWESDTIIIPETISYDGNTYMVTEIGKYAFREAIKLRSVNIPKTVSNIGYGAFAECKNLTSVVMSEGIINIEEDAFSYCYSLTSIEFPKSVTNIEHDSFYGCGLTSITFSDNSELTKIGSYAFYGTDLKMLTLPKNVTTIGEYAFPKSMKEIKCLSEIPPTIGISYIDYVYVPKGCGIAYKSNSSWSGCVIIDGEGVSVNVRVSPGLLGEEVLNKIDYLSDVNYLTISGKINETDIHLLKNSFTNLITIDMSELDMRTIPANMFYENMHIKHVVLPNNTETINTNAFCRCLNLENITLPEGLTTINDGTKEQGANGFLLRGCFSETSLKSIILPSTLVTLGTNAFAYCDIKEVKCGDRLNKIGNYAFYDCTALSKIELGKNIASLGEYTFYNCNSLKEILLNDSLKSIGASCFERCGHLKNIEFNNQLETIGSNAFMDCDSLLTLKFKNNLKIISDKAFRDCINLQSINFADGINKIGSQAFYGCTSLQQINLPKGLDEISWGLFYDCTQLQKIEIPEGVSYIAGSAFTNCINLTEVTLPSTLHRLDDRVFCFCNGIKKIHCLALFPPNLGNNVFNSGGVISTILNVPAWTLNRYKQSDEWSRFYQIEPIDNIYPSSINVIGDEVLTLPKQGLPTDYQPNMSILNQSKEAGSSLHLRGGDNMRLKTFKLEGALQNIPLWSQLYNEVNVVADSINLALSLVGNTNWYFLSLPFDVLVSEVNTDCDWVVREYDSEARALGKNSATWKTVPYDSIIHSGKGYIWACSGGNFTIPALDNENKNKIFANTDQKIGLNDFISETISNSSWNLVGNPYPCHYDIRFMDYEAPIIVWNMVNRTYSAYSPIDDSYILRPFEAFFVQKPEDIDTIHFRVDGRQLDSTPDTLRSFAMPRMKQVGQERHVINIVLSDECYSDFTRIVINDKAKMEYEMERDASKFVSDDINVPQIFSMTEQDTYSINERPLNNGTVKLGTRFGKDGQYTLALKNDIKIPAVLKDLKTGKEVMLNNENYTFYAETTDVDRFEVRLYYNERPTLIEEISNKADISCDDTGIKVVLPKDSDVKLYNTSGQLLNAARGSNFLFSVSNGVYIINVNGDAHKVVVGR